MGALMVLARKKIVTVLLVDMKVTSTDQDASTEIAVTSTDRDAITEIAAIITGQDVVVKMDYARNLQEGVLKMGNAKDTITTASARTNIAIVTRVAPRNATRNVKMRTASARVCAATAITVAGRRLMILWEKGPPKRLLMVC